MVQAILVSLVMDVKYCYPLLLLENIFYCIHLDIHVLQSAYLSLIDALQCFIEFFGKKRTENTLWFHLAVYMTTKRQDLW